MNIEAEKARAELADVETTAIDREATDMEYAYQQLSQVTENLVDDVYRLRGRLADVLREDPAEQVVATQSRPYATSVPLAATLWTRIIRLDDVRNVLSDIENRLGL